MTEPLDPTMPLEIRRRKIGAMWQWRIFGLSDMMVSRLKLRIGTLNIFNKFSVFNLVLNVFLFDQRKFSWHGGHGGHAHCASVGEDVNNNPYCLQTCT